MGFRDSTKNVACLFFELQKKYGHVAFFYSSFPAAQRLEKHMGNGALPKRALAVVMTDATASWPWQARNAAGHQQYLSTGSEEST